MFWNAHAQFRNEHVIQFLQEKHFSYLIALVISEKNVWIFS